jgi:hypothetical protein
MVKSGAKNAIRASDQTENPIRRSAYREPIAPPSSAPRIAKAIPADPGSVAIAAPAIAPSRIPGAIPLNGF